MSISNPAAIRSGSWDQWFEYVAGDIVLGSDRNLYRALLANKNTSPLGGNATWEYLPLPRQYSTTAALLAGTPDYSGQIASAADGGLAVATGGAFSQAFSIASLTTSGNASVGGTLGVTGAATMALIQANSSATTEFSLVNAASASGGASQANVLKIQTTSASGFAAIRFCGSDGAEHCAIGYGNASTPNSLYAQTAFWEISDATNLGNAVAGGIAQYSTFNGAQSYGAAWRQRFEQDGTINFYQIGNGTSTGTTAYTALQLSPSTNVVTIYPGLPASSTCSLNFATPGSGNGGSSIVVNNSGAGTTFVGNGWLAVQGNDQHNQIRMRDGTHNYNTFTSYGDTMANGGGHNFFTGGLYPGAQTKKVQIANDGVAITSVPLYLAQSAATNESGFTATNGAMYYDTTNNRIRVYVNGAWKTVSAS